MLQHILVSKNIFSIYVLIIAPLQPQCVFGGFCSLYADTHTILPCNNFQIPLHYPLHMNRITIGLHVLNIYMQEIMKWNLEVIIGQDDMGTGIERAETSKTNFVPNFARES